MTCSPRTDTHTDTHTDTQTHRHTDTYTDTDRVTTKGTLSGFQDFFLQPIIKDRPNNWMKLKPKKCDNELETDFPIQSHEHSCPAACT